MAGTLERKNYLWWEMPFLLNLAITCSQAMSRSSLPFMLKIWLSSVLKTTSSRQSAWEKRWWVKMVTLCLLSSRKPLRTIFWPTQTSTSRRWKRPAQLIIPPFIAKSPLKAIQPLRFSPWMTLTGKISLRRIVRGPSNGEFRPVLHGITSKTALWVRSSISRKLERTSKRWGSSSD